MAALTQDLHEQMYECNKHACDDGRPGNHNAPQLRATITSHYHSPYSLATFTRHSSSLRPSASLTSDFRLPDLRLPLWVLYCIT